MPRQLTGLDLVERAYRLFEFHLERELTVDEKAEVFCLSFLGSGLSYHKMVSSGEESENLEAIFGPAGVDEGKMEIQAGLDFSGDLVLDGSGMEEEPADPKGTG